MKVLIATDSYKESMSAIEATKAIQSGIHQFDSTIQTVACPLADGGEGTMKTLVSALSGTIKTYEVKGALLEPKEVEVGFVRDTAIIESALVCGLEDVAVKDPYLTSTYGLGQLILKVIKEGYHKIFICLGGSATNDGGLGMLQALGGLFLDEEGKEVTPTLEGLFNTQTVDLSHFNSQLSQLEITGLCDVDNPLCGNKGATYIYGPQKGLSQFELETVDNAMYQYALKVDSSKIEEPGAGAAGGLGFALKVLHASLQKGFDVIAKATHLEEKIIESDFVIVGEGKLDKQTQFGKTPYGVLLIAKKHGKPVFAFGGRVEDKELLQTMGFCQIYEISPRSLELERALSKGASYLQKAIDEHMEEMLNEI